MQHPGGSRLQLPRHQFDTFRTAVDFVHDEARQVRVCREEVEVPLHPLSYLVRQGQVAFLDGAQHDFAQQSHLFGDYPFEKLVLRTEIVVKHGVRDAGSLGDGCGSRSAVAPFQELPLGSLKDFGLSVFRVSVCCLHGAVRLV